MIRSRPSLSRAPIASLLLLTAALASGVPAAFAQADDMFPTRAAAERRAKQLGCSGAFAMGGEWMPCRDFAAYQKAMQKRQP